MLLLIPLFLTLLGAEAQQFGSEFYSRPPLLRDFLTHFQSFRSYHAFWQLQLGGIR